MVKEGSMKERIKRLVENGGICLIGGWGNLGVMLYLVVDSALDKSVVGCFASVCVSLPWTLLFFSSYKYQKEAVELIDDNKELIGICSELLKERKRYKELYGELPKEETKEESHDTDK